MATRKDEPSEARLSRRDDRARARAATAIAPISTPKEDRRRGWRDAREQRRAERALLGERVAENSPRAAPWVVTACLRDRDGDAFGAEVACRQALRSDPADVEARFRPARRALREGRDGEARAWLVEIRRIEDARGRGSSRPREE